MFGYGVSGKWVLFFYSVDWFLKCISYRDIFVKGYYLNLIFWIKIKISIYLKMERLIYSYIR